MTVPDERLRKRRCRSHAVSRRQLTGVVALALCLCGAPAAGGGATTTRFASAGDASWSATGRKLVFVGYEEAGPRARGALYVMNPDGSGVRRITPFMRRIHGPSWAPDGRRIAFGWGDEIAVAAADGGGVRRLGRSGGSPDWSPGGRWIAYDHFVRIDAVTPDGKRRAIVADPAVRDRGEHFFMIPSWSPDGERLVFCMIPEADLNTGAYLGVVSQFGGPITRISVGSAVNPHDPDWAPDGRRIAYAALGVDSVFTIAVLDLRTRRIQMLRRGRSPAWSPDGRRIAFNSEGQLHVMDADGSNVRQLTLAP